MKKKLQKVVEVSRKDSFDKYRFIAKTNEEFGEMCEAILFEDGELPGKNLKEDAMHEAADTIQCVIAILAKHHPELTPEELVEQLGEALKKKTKKYEKKIIKRHG